MWEGQASDGEGAEAHRGLMTHLFAGFNRGRVCAVVGVGGRNNSLNRRMPMLMSLSGPVRSL